MLHEEIPNDLLEALQTARKSDSPINVLPLCRKYIDLFNPIIDQAIEWDLLHMPFASDFQGLRGFGYNLDDDNQPSLLGYEFDFVTFSKEFDENYPPSVFTIIRFLAIILASDCTGCCDTLDFIVISKGGIFTQGNVSMSYHS